MRITAALVVLLCATILSAKEKISLFTTVTSNQTESFRSAPAVETQFFWFGTGDVRRLRSHPHATIEGLALPSSGNITLEVSEFRVFDDDAAFVQGTDTGDAPIARPAMNFYRGRVSGEDHSFVYFALSDCRIQGYVETRGERYILSTLDENVCALYRERSAPETARQWDCFTEDPGFAPNITLKDSLSITSSSVTIKVALEADYETYLRFRSNVDTAAAYLSSLYGAVAAVYSRDAQVTLNISYVRIWSTINDPYTALTLSSALSQFRNIWESSQSAVSRGAAQFITSKTEFAGGLSYVDALCTSYGYSVCSIDGIYSYPTTNYTWDVHVTAHELGHVFGARHTHNCSWAPAIDSCYTSEGGCFTGIVPAWGEIMSYCHIYGLGVNIYFHPKVGALLHDKGESSPCNEDAMPLMTLPINPFNMGNVISGSSKVFNVPVANSGTVPLKITKVTFCGTNRSEYKTDNGVAPLTIPQGTTTMIPVRFSPAGIGSRVATIEIESNVAGLLTKIFLTGNGLASSSVGDVSETVRGALSQNFPNPFTRGTSTIIRFELYEASVVTLSIANTLGETVRTLATAFYSDGAHEVRLALDDLPAGMYLYRLQTSSGILSRTMVLAR